MTCQRCAQRSAELPAWVAGNLGEILANTCIHSPSSFRIGNQAPVDLRALSAGPAQAPAGTSPGPAANDSLLSETLWPNLYWTFYARGTLALCEEPLSEAAEALVDNDFVQQLSAVNGSRERFDSGWSVYQLGLDGCVHIRKGDAFRLARPGEYVLAAARGRSPHLGDPVLLMMPRENAQLQPGFYYAFGETPASDFDDSELSRFYFNVDADHVRMLIDGLSSRLNRYRIPYRFKCISHPRRLTRSDGAVLYIAKRFMGLATALVIEAVSEPALALRARVPSFAKPILPGLGVADDPGTAESFGQSRMRLIAAGLVQAFVARATDSGARLRAIREQFEAAGLCLAAPHLAAGNVDVYPDNSALITEVAA